MSDQLHLLVLAVLVWATLAASVGAVLWLAYRAPTRRGTGSPRR